MRTPRSVRLGKALLPLCLLAAMPAFAVSLGQMQLQSGLGQPLSAQIPVFDADASEINSLYVQLASDDAFKRLGIDRSLYRDIQIRIISNESGQTFVQLSTEKPFNEPVFNVLLDANWNNGGRLVKEVTALVDPPFIANAAVQTIEAPTVALTPVVAAPIAAPSVPVAEPIAPKVLSAKPAETKPTKAKQAATKTVAKAPPAQAAATPSAPLPRIPATAENQREVQNNESLYVIAQQRSAQLPAARISLNQMMRAIQRANPDAFIKGDANKLKRGSVLRLPDEQQVRALLPEDSANLLGNQWARKVQAQPAPVLSAANKLNQQVAKPAPARVAAPVVNQGTLKIVPTVGAMNNAGSQSGASKTGQGAELRAENTAAQEDLAAKQAEISNLRTQLDTAGKTQAESQRLIELQNSQIKQLTQRMKEMKAKGEQTTNSPVVESAAKPSSESAWYFSPYAVFAALLLIAGLLGVLLKRKR